LFTSGSNELLLRSQAGEMNQLRSETKQVFTHCFVRCEAVNN